MPETSRIGHLYRDWVIDNSLSEKISILINKGDIANEIQDDYKLLLFPGSPSRYLARPFFDVYLRSLLLSGVASHVTFVAPSWSYSNMDLRMSENLMSSFTLRSFPTLNLVGKTSIDNNQEKPIEEWERDDSFSTSQSYEVFEVGGSVPCKLIMLGDELVYPIEEDAKRVTVLVKDIEKGVWKIESRDPFSGLEKGEFLVACVGRSETQDLRNRAARKMGEDFQEFFLQQKEWKSRLELLLQKGSSKEVEERLTEAAVSKANRARYWVLPEAIQPAIKSDFYSLLKYLDFVPTEIEKITRLANSYESLLIAEGREAAKAISETLDEFEYSKLERGESIEMTLENFGDATYLISPNQGILDEEVYCRPSQVRQVIQYKVGGNLT